MCKKPLERLAEKIQHEKDRAQGKILRLPETNHRNQKIRSSLGRGRDQADNFLLSFIQNELNGNGEPDEQPETKYPEGEE